MFLLDAMQDLFSFNGHKFDYWSINMVVPQQILTKLMVKLYINNVTKTKISFFVH